VTRSESELAPAPAVCDSDGVLDAAELLQVYDHQLRGAAEVTTATTWQRHGPLFWAVYEDRHGFVSYRSLAADQDRLAALVTATKAHYESMPDVTDVEWKTRGHDVAPGLSELLREHGFEPQPTESVMLGEARAMAGDVDLPPGVSVRRVTDEADVRRMAAMQAVVFADGRANEGHIAELLRRVGSGADGLELWVAEVDGRVVSAGRLEPVPGTEVAGIWGGATLPEWRGRGIYRALTAERARSALQRGFRYLHSDSTEFSRPILERSGFVKITTTTPYEWQRDPAGG
jgi:N-acetylglutamate synthase-like GNAT family acetyltransferase